MESAAGGKKFGAMTLTEFCRAYRLNRHTVYRMLQAGTGPDTIQVGRKRLITFEAAREWEQRFTRRAADADEKEA